MNRLIERCAMLDVHKSQISACVRVPDRAGGRRQEMREFATTSSALLTLADWLRSWAVTVVGMESTGVYWRALFYLLEDEFDCRLYNARHLRHVPGRKSDRKAKIQERTREVQRAQITSSTPRTRVPSTCSASCSHVRSEAPEPGAVLSGQCERPGPRRGSDRARLRRRSTARPTGALNGRGGRSRRRSPALR